MKKLLPILFFFLSCSSVNNQETPERDAFDKADVEKEDETIVVNFQEFDADRKFFDGLEELRITFEEKLTLLEEVLPHYDYYFESEYYELPLIENFKFLELNGDGKPDLLFFGESGGEPFCVDIHLSSKNGFLNPLTFYQYLTDMKIENGFLKSLTVVDPGCCAEYRETETIYSFDKNFEPEIVQIKARIFGPHEKKYEVLKEPVNFRIVSSFNRLRGLPQIDDTGTFIYDYPEQGNTIAIFEKGHKGKAWMVDRSDPEREWWYVEMEPVKDTLSFDAFFIENNPKMKRLGWMSSRYLEKE